MLEVVHFYLSDVSACHSIIDILLSLLGARVAADHSLVLYVLLAGVRHQVGDSEHLGLRWAVPALPQQVLCHDLLVELVSLGLLRGPVAIRLSNRLFG